MYKILIKPVLFFFQSENSHHIVAFHLMIQRASSLLWFVHNRKYAKLEHLFFEFIFPSPVGSSVNTINKAIAKWKK